MRTADDLLSALAAREDLAPEPDPVLAGARAAATRYRRRRVLTAAGMVAAIVVAAGITVPVLLDRAGPPVIVPEDPAATRPPFAFTIQAGAVAGFEIHPWAVGPDYQIARVWPAGADEPVADLVVYRPDLESGVGEGEALLRWEYTPGGFAEIQGEPGPLLDDAALQQLADGVEFTSPYPVRLPYRLDYLPAGMTPTIIGQDTARPAAFGSGIALEDLTADPSAPPVIDITVGAGFPIDDSDWDPQPTTVAGFPAECGDVVDGRHCRIELDEFTLNVGYANIDDAELARIIAGLQPATWDDPATWYEVDVAIPSG